MRGYNSILSFTSVGAKIDNELATGALGVFTYQLHGELTHRIGSLLPAQGDSPKFLQLYIYDTENELKNRMAQMRGKDGEDRLDPATLQELMNVLREVNPYVAVFRQAINVLRENPPVHIGCAELFAFLDTFSSKINFHETSYLYVLAFWLS